MTFGDTQSADCKAVQVEETNVADPVNVPANTTPEPTPDPAVVKHETPPEATVHIDEDDDGYRGGVRRRAFHHRRMGHRRR